MSFQELSAQKKENVRMECGRENMNGLLEYLRSLDADMVRAGKCFFIRLSCCGTELTLFDPTITLKLSHYLYFFIFQVTELSQPSSVQVEEMIHQLVQNILQRFFKDACMRDSGIVNTGNLQDAADETCGTFGTSRDYLAKLLFWYVFMLLLFTS